MDTIANYPQLHHFLLFSELVCTSHGFLLSCLFFFLAILFILVKSFGVGIINFFSILFLLGILHVRRSQVLRKLFLWMGFSGFFGRDAVLALLRVTPLFTSRHVSTLGVLREHNSYLTHLVHILGEHFGFKTSGYWRFYFVSFFARKSTQILILNIYHRI